MNKKVRIYVLVNNSNMKKFFRNGEGFSTYMQRRATVFDLDKLEDRQTVCQQKNAYIEHI